MNRIYKVGPDPAASIQLQVKVHTAGIAGTAADLNRTGGIQSQIAESELGSGDIGKTKIGTALEVKEAVLVVTTAVTLGNLSEAERAIARDNIKLFYTISGGFSQEQIYNHDKDDVRTFEKGKIIVITKAIRFIE